MSDTQQDLFQGNNKKEFDELQLEPEELQKIIYDKDKLINSLNAEINDHKKEILNMQARAFKVHEKNKLYEADPSLASEMARMEFQLSIAAKFILSKAFKAKSAEEAYVIIKAGAEMGLKPVEAMQTLYIVNGAVKPYGDKMLSLITKHGYKVEYLDETEKSVTVRCYDPKGDFDVKEVVNDTDQIIIQSKAKTFAKKNKLRFHGIRMIASFHLPHLFNSVQDEFTIDYNESLQELKPGQSKERQRILSHIQRSVEANDLAMLEKVKGHKVEFDLVYEYDQALLKITQQ